MDSYKISGRITGALFLTVMVAYSIGTLVFIEPVLSASDYPGNVAGNQNALVTGVLFELINDLAYLGIAVLVFPFFKQYSESLALGYVGLRIIEFVFQIASDISPLLLITLSDRYASAGKAEVACFQTTGALLLALRFWTSQIVFLVYGLSAMIFYLLLHQLKLVPRFLSVWGLIGAPLVLINVILDIFKINPGLNLGIVTGLNEIVLGIWLVFKGFKSPAVVKIQ